MRRTLPIAALAAAVVLAHATPRHAAASRADAGELRAAANQRARTRDLSIRHGQSSGLRIGTHPVGKHGQPTRR